MIIIPDIHGRAFWKEAVKGRKPREEVVFLGDYMDPYEYEGISYTDASKNFDEIIKYKKKSPKLVTLLLGNHDVHYLNGYASGSRYDSFHAREIREKFEKNRELFQLAYEKKIGGKRFIFSHAGIHKLWIDDWFGKVVTNRNVVDYLNNLYLIDSPDLPRALDQYSAYRGGWESYGSIVWADIREWRGAKDSSYGDVQIFGHTQLKDFPVNLNNAVYDLDVRRGFRINEGGEVCEMDGKVIPISK